MAMYLWLLVPPLLLLWYTKAICIYLVMIKAQRLTVTAQENSLYSLT